MIFLVLPLMVKLLVAEAVIPEYLPVRLFRVMYVRLLRAVYGYVRQCTAMQGYVELCRAMYGYVGPFRVMYREIQGHRKSVFGKYLFGRRFEIQNFRNICFKTFCLPASTRIFEHLKNVIIAHFLKDFYTKKVTQNFWEIRIDEKFLGVKICLYLPFK